VFDPAGATWTELAPMDGGRSDFLLGATADGLIAVGGTQIEFFFFRREQRTTEFYDLKSDHWSSRPLFPTSIAGGSVCSIDRDLYVMGNTARSTTPIRLSSVENRWIPLPGINMAPNSNIVAIGNVLYLVHRNSDGRPVSTQIGKVLFSFKKA
jgi:hypothetical protein